MITVSVITVCFNSASTIRDTINSVLEQDYPCIEYLVIDGASTDGTVEIVKDFGDKISNIISEPDDGIYDAMNKGIEVATGDVVCMLNSDDTYASSSSVRNLVECMESEGTDTVFADLVITAPLDTGHILRYCDASRFNLSRFRFGWMPPHPTFLAKRELYKNWGYYSLKYKIASDYEMMVRLLYKARVSYAYLPKVVVKMRAGGISTAGFRSSWVLNKEIVDACRVNGLKTNIFNVLLKIPEKILEYFRKPKSAISVDAE